MAAPLASRKKPGMTPAEKEERNALIEEHSRMTNILLGRGVNAPISTRHRLIEMTPDELKKELANIRKVLLRKR